MFFFYYNTVCIPKYHLDTFSDLWIELFNFKNNQKMNFWLIHYIPIRSWCNFKVRSIELIQECCSFANNEKLKRTPFMFMMHEWNERYKTLHDIYTIASSTIYGFCCLKSLNINSIQYCVCVLSSEPYVLCVSSKRTVHREEKFWSRKINHKIYNKKYLETE